MLSVKQTTEEYPGTKFTQNEVEESSICDTPEHILYAEDDPNEVMFNFL